MKLALLQIYCGLRSDVDHFYQLREGIDSHLGFFFCTLFYIFHSLFGFCVLDSSLQFHFTCFSRTFWILFWIVCFVFYFTFSLWIIWIGSWSFLIFHSLLSLYLGVFCFVFINFTYCSDYVLDFSQFYFTHFTCHLNCILDFFSISFYWFIFENCNTIVRNVLCILFELFYVFWIFLVFWIFTFRKRLKNVCTFGNLLLSIDQRHEYFKYFNYVRCIICKFSNHLFNFQIPWYF